MKTNKIEDLTYIIDGEDYLFKIKINGNSHMFRINKQEPILHIFQKVAYETVEMINSNVNNN